MATKKPERIDAHWSRFLGVPVSALQGSGIAVTPHAQLTGYHGVWFFVRAHGAVISAPPEWVVRLERACGSCASEQLLDSDFVRLALDGAAGEIVGPSFQGWLPVEGFRPAPSEGVRCLLTPEVEVIETFKSSCPRQEWDDSGIDATSADVWAAFDGDRAVALARLRPHAGGAVDPCVITHPAHRGRGHALRVVGALTERAVAAEQLVLYQTLQSNTAAVAVAKRLGFEEYATLLAVRLLPDAA